MNIIEEITQNKFLLVLLSEEQYINQLIEIVKSVEKSKNKICYVCLSKPYKDVLDDLKKNNINTKIFFFVDILSSHYEKHRSRSNCIFLKSPTDLKVIGDTIKGVIKEKNCNVVLFDTISTLLLYQSSFFILRFTHGLKTEKEQANVKKIFIVLKNDMIPEQENKEFIEDLRMFADKTLDLG